VNDPFYSYSRYLKEKYGVPAYRVSIDAGFSCPNRGRERSKPGCSYCDEYGSRAPYQERSGGTRKGKAPQQHLLSSANRESIRRQVEGGIRFLRSRYRAQVFLLYFQAFSNTFAPVGDLKKLYDYALGLAQFEELIVSTRPDCIDEMKAGLLAGYRDSLRDVWVELGLQSASDITLRRINREHTVNDFLSAYRLLRSAGVKLTVHLIFGLPGEDLREILDTVDLVASLEPEGIKIHNLHIPYGTKMLEEYRLGEITVPGSRRHLEHVIRALEHLPESTVIMRVTCDTPASRLALPKHFRDKAGFYTSLREEMLARNTFQGRRLMITGSRSP
jgi:radical SAM protein (TIGR01212 family)